MDHSKQNLDEQIRLRQSRRRWLLREHAAPARDLLFAYGFIRADVEIKPIKIGATDPMVANQVQEGVMDSQAQLRLELFVRLASWSLPDETDDSRAKCPVL